MDSTIDELRRRHSKMLLVDSTLIAQNCSPAGLAANVDFNDDLNKVFTKTGQSLLAAGHILRDQIMFQVRGPTLQQESEHVVIQAICFFPN